MWRASEAHRSEADRLVGEKTQEEKAMTVLAPVLMAAAGYSLLYLLMGGGLGGAILIFIVAKMLGK